MLPPAPSIKQSCRWAAYLGCVDPLVFSRYLKPYHVSRNKHQGWLYKGNLALGCQKSLCCFDFLVLAIELLAACQGIEFLRPLRTTTPLEKVYDLVRSVVR